MTNFGANDQDRIDGDAGGRDAMGDAGGKRRDGDAGGRDAMGTRGEETRLIASLRWIVFIFKYQ
jgi:hypothetical protein